MLADGAAQIGRLIDDDVAAQRLVAWTMTSARHSSRGCALR